MPVTPQIETQILSGPLQPAPPLIGGGVAQFVGRTRQETHPEHGPLLHLDYAMNGPLATAELRRLGEEAARKWSLLAVRIRHASGPVAPGQASVDIETAADHRDAAFAACRWIIDTLKQRVPIWKHEVWKSGTTWACGTPATQT